LAELAEIFGEWVVHGRDWIMSDGIRPLPQADRMPEGLEGEILVLDPRALLPGDVILSTATGFESWLIRKATGSAFSHAALHVGHGVAIEANDPGVVSVFLPVLAHTSATRLAVKRIVNLTVDEREQLVQLALDAVYRPYSTRGAISAVPIAAILRKTADPGMFCSQLVAHCYEQINRPICCTKDPASCTPQDLANSMVLDPVLNAVRSTKTVIHAAVVSPYANRYAAFLESSFRSERALVVKVEAMLSPPVPNRSFNIFDLIRQLRTAELSKTERETWDDLISQTIQAHFEQSPLLPAPGLSIATFLFLPPPLPAINSWAWEIISSEDGRKAFKEKTESVFSASKWELDRWLSEAERLGENAEYECEMALATWMRLAAEIRLMYGELAASSSRPGSVPDNRKSKIKAILRELRDTDPIGAKEFGFDTFMLLDQDVAP
jgi:hypothetical protein